ncbi:MAG TPA: DUF4411 family protein [Bacteroidales bacterium]|nr:DUF4411 family protein [Bacteroidales bacterium]
MGVYIVDSNFFIQAHRETYPLDVAFSFWNKVRELAVVGKIICIDKVREEIYNKNDALESWCKANLPADFFKDTSEVIPEYQQVVGWAISKNAHYSTQAINEFLDADEADAFLIAFAMKDTISRTIVTQEVSNPKMKSKIKIPEPCAIFNVRYIKAIEVFRELGVTF